MELLNDSQVMKTAIGVDAFYHLLVKEFRINLPKVFNDAESYENINFHVRGHCFIFSHAIIHEYLGRGKLIIADLVPLTKISLKKLLITSMMTGRPRVCSLPPIQV